jgi:hypothetical protein
VERRNIMAETEILKELGLKHKNNHFEGAKTNTCSINFNLLISRKEYTQKK